MLGLCCCTGFSLVAVGRGYSLVAVCGLLIAVASLAEEHGLSGADFSRLQQLWYKGSVFAAPRSKSTGSVVVVHRLSNSVACGIFPDQGSNPCRLHWQVNSSPLRHQGTPVYILF